MYYYNNLGLLSKKNMKKRLMVMFNRWNKNPAIIQLFKFPFIIGQKKEWLSVANINQTSSKALNNYHQYDKMQYQAS